jgi:hypothetical protein
MTGTESVAGGVRLWVAPPDSDPTRPDPGTWTDLGLVADVKFAAAVQDDEEDWQPAWLLCEFHVSIDYKITKAQLRALRRLFGRHPAQLRRQHPPVKALGRHRVRVERARRRAG